MWPGLPKHQPRDAGQLAVTRETAAKLLPNRPDDLACAPDASGSGALAWGNEWWA
jgi:hypothetical protein